MPNCAISGPILHTKTACRGRFAFPQNATLEQNLRFNVLRESYFTSRKTNASFLRLSKNHRLNHLPPIEASPFQTERRAVWSRPANNKKPGVKRRADPSVSGPLFPRNPKRMYSKLDCRLSGARNQSHLFEKARLGFRTALGNAQGTTDFNGV